MQHGHMIKIKNRLGYQLAARRNFVKIKTRFHPKTHTKIVVNSCFGVFLGVSTKGLPQVTIKVILTFSI